MSNYQGGTPVLINCTFMSNTASATGGGICGDGGLLRVTGCVFISNAAGSGGAMRNRFSTSPATIAMASTLGRGTAVIVTLPLVEMPE